MTATRCRERNKNPGLDAKAWLNGHIVQLRTGWLHLADEILPAYQYSSVGANDGSLQEAHPENHDLEMDDLVTVEGLEKNGIIEATKITIHRDWLKCRETKGEKPTHCKF